MISQRLLLTARLLTVVVISLGSTLTCMAHGGGGHGGGGGHALVRGGFPGCGFRGGLGYRGFYRYPGFFYGFPGFYGFGLGYGYGGYGYGYPYYPYAGGYPVYVAPGYGPPAPAACPVAGPGPAPAPSTSSVPTAPIRLTDSDMLLSMRVPPDAVVRINGEKTNQSGPRREFLSSGLSPGRTYTFVVTAQWTEPDGQDVQLERRVQVQGGERRNVDFLTPLAAARSLR